ncbi:MAG: 2OG-Fe(II) oxygenase [Mycobacteriales bacterium]
MIDYEMIEARRDEFRDSFRCASPFPHVTFNGLYEPEALREAAQHFPTVAEMNIHFKSRHEFKAAQSDLSTVHPALRAAFDELNSERFVSWLSYVTDLPELLTDPTNLGGGLHQSGRGMYLDVHADFNRHTQNDWFRQLNVLVYLNDDWRHEWGGVLQLWDKDMTAAEVSVLPLFNHTVIFRTSSDSFHGYDTIEVPDGVMRRSLAAYYYTSAAPEDYAGVDHTTKFMARPGQEVRHVRGEGLKDATRRGKHALAKALGRRG